MSYSIESITESIGARRMGNAPATIDSVSYTHLTLPTIA